MKMKNLVWVIALSATLLPAEAQLFSRESMGGAVLGGLAGGIIGHNSGRKTAEGMAIGAGAGLVLGALTHQPRRDYDGAQVSAPVAAGYYYEPVRPNYAITGAAMGGLAGGIIGHNNGRKTAEGIAIGAGAGLLLGGLAEHHARRQVVHTVAPAYVVAQPQTVPADPATLTPPAQPTEPAPVINNGYGSSSPMAGANSLFGR